MVNGQKEIWKRVRDKIKGKHISKKTVIAISNCGRCMLANGEITIAELRKSICYNGRNKTLSSILAELFIPKSEDDIIKNRNIVDHITHNPSNMHVNDVRNLRWCTKKENSNFEEAIINMTKANKEIANRIDVKEKFIKRLNVRWGNY